MKKSRTPIYSHQANSHNFISELRAFAKHYKRRPTPVIIAQAVRKIGGKGIYLLNEKDLNHTGCA